MHKDRYKNFADLAAHETEGVDYSISAVRRPGSTIAVIAPHGGGIEPGTTRITRAIAGNELSLYLFEGIKKTGNKVLHITSHRFDEPQCIELVGQCDSVVAIHGCDYDGEQVLLGGLDKALKDRLSGALRQTGLHVETDGHPLQATDRNNICNRGRSGKGVQLELTAALRNGNNRDRLVQAVRSVFLRTHPEPNP